MSSLTRIGVLVSGSGTNLQALIDASDRDDLGGGKISLVLSNKEDSFALERAKKAGIKAGIEKDLLSQLEEESIDLIVLAGYLKKIRPDIVDSYKNKIINIHPSLLPAFSGKGFYGIRVHQAAINRGVRYSGCTTHFVNDEMDGGPIIYQRVVKVYQTDSPENLQKRVLEEEHKILPKTVRDYCLGLISLEDGRVKIREED